MDLENFFDETLYPLIKEDITLPSAALSFQEKALYVYLFYHYLGGDPDDSVKLPEMVVRYVPFGDMSLSALCKNVTSDNDSTVDYVFTLGNVGFHTRFLSDPGFYFQKICDLIVGIISADKTTLDRLLRDMHGRYYDIDLESFKDVHHVAKILFPFPITAEEKTKARQLVRQFSVSREFDLSFEIILEDDIVEEINSLTNPSDWVDKGELTLVSSPDNLCRFGEEDSFIGLISAASLKECFLENASRGLFAANLRYYVKSKKIDIPIMKTISDDPDWFPYLNNGMIIVCRDYQIAGDKLMLTDFSIVNGCQTTTLIGNSEITRDFPVVAKVVRLAPSKDTDMIDFISRIAEASNAQKPINAKDLIANRTEQRLLKEQFASAGMFLKIKRGDRPDLIRYNEKWKQASNDEVAQMLYSTVYQHPGEARNSKSVILSNKKKYQIIFSETYSNEFFISLQKIKVAYKEYVKHLKTSGSSSTIAFNMKYGLASNGTFGVFAIIGFMLKYFTVPNFSDLLEEYYVGKNRKDFFLSDEFRYLVSKRDIGDFHILSKGALERLEINKNKSLFLFFEEIVTGILTPAYKDYSQIIGAPSYSNFLKTDINHYRYIIPQAYKYCRSNRYTCENFLNINVETDRIADFENNEDKIFTSCEAELKDLSTRMGRGYTISKNQLAWLQTFWPTTEAELINKAHLSEKQVSGMGQKILQILAKYSPRNASIVRAEEQNDFDAQQ